MQEYKASDSQSLAIRTVSHSEPLSESQLQIIENAQQFIKANSPEIEEKLKSCTWNDMYAVISSNLVDNNTKIVCCSVLKWLIFHKKFATDPHAIFKAFFQYYMQRDYKGAHVVTKSQEIIYIVLKSIPNAYFNYRQREELIEELLGQLGKDFEYAPKILTIIALLVEEAYAEKINNYVISGELLIFLEKVIEFQMDPNLKLYIFKSCFKLIQSIIDLINEESYTDANNVYEFLCCSTLAKRILTKVIFEGSKYQIITSNKLMNEVKLLTMELYGSIWMYSVDYDMFKLCLSTIITGPNVLYDDQSGILEKAVCFVERSLSDQSYYQILYHNVQSIMLSLMKYLSPTQPLLSLMYKDPEYYVSFEYDLIMTQQNDHLATKVCSLISSLCLYIDGYMSQIGTLCIMVIKMWGSGLQDVPTGEQYMQTVNSLWKADLEEKVAVCALVICCIHDQFEKRVELSRPLSAELEKIINIFDPQTCKLSPLLISRFMLLYTLMSHPKNIIKFLGFSSKGHLILSYQLQLCYKILSRYSSRNPEYYPFTKQMSCTVVSTSKLTPMFEDFIIKGDLEGDILWKIFEKLVNWLQSAIYKGDRIAASKMANLITQAIDRMNVSDYNVSGEMLWGLLMPLWKISAYRGNDSEQFLMEIAVSYVRKFPNIQNDIQKLMFFLNIGSETIARNHNTLNNCLDLFFELTKYLPSNLLLILVQTYLSCLQAQQNREEDVYECYYGLYITMLRLKQLKMHPPPIDVKSIIENVQMYRCPVLRIKVYMFVFAYILAIDPIPSCPFLKKIDLGLPVPVYENKTYCMYLMELAHYIVADPYMARNLLSILIQLINRYQSIKSLIYTYSNEVYTYNSSYCEINAYTIFTKLPHPFLAENFNIYEKFKSIWGNFPFKGEILQGLNSYELAQVYNLCSLWGGYVKGQRKVRKIYTVKKYFQYNDNPSNYSATEKMAY